MFLRTSCHTADNINAKTFKVSSFLPLSEDNERVTVLRLFAWVRYVQGAERDGNSWQGLERLEWAHGHQHTYWHADAPMVLGHQASALWTCMQASKNSNPEKHISERAKSKTHEIETSNAERQQIGHWLEHDPLTIAM